MTDAFDNATFYTCDEHAETLTHEHPEDAIFAFFDEATGGDAVSERIREWSPLTVYAYQRDEVSKQWLSGQAERLAEDFAESYSDSYGAPDGGPIKGCDMDNLCSALRGVLAEAVTETPPWSCTKVATRVYDAAEVERILREADPKWFEAAE